MVELWRNDSWASPLYGGEELQLLRTDTDTDTSELMVDSASVSFVPTSCAFQALRPASLKSGTNQLLQAGLNAVRQAAAHVVPADATYASQPVLRGAACRTDADLNVAVPLASPKRLSCKRKLSDTDVAVTDLAAEGLSGFPGSELPALTWEETELPVETAWMFDACSEPLPSILTDLYPECEDDDEPESPTLVFTDKAACPSDSSASACASNCTEPEVQGGKTMENDTGSSDDGPASSADTASTRMRSSAVDSPTDTSADSAAVAVANPVAKSDCTAENDEKVLSEVDSQEMNSRTTKKPRRAAANRSSTRPGAAKAAMTLPSKAPAAAATKKQKGRQCCVQCFTFSTPQWREGPQGARTLCNACGVRYRKQLNQAKKLKGK